MSGCIRLNSRKEYGESAYISAQFSFVSIEWTIRVEEIWQK
jgi:hypothetical protein